MASKPKLKISKIAKLNEDDVRSIVRQWRNGRSQCQLGRDFAVSQTTIFMIVHGKIYRKITRIKQAA